jgi:hypothetical protein
MLSLSRGTNAVDDRKAARRRKSLEMMQKSTQSKTIKNVIDDAIIGDSNIHTEGTAEERLHLVLTKAKEKSMTAENIFQFFSGNPNITTVSVEKFIANLGKLGGSFVSFSPEEIMILVKAISKNDYSVISLEEFKHYCANDIQTIPWKAERLRLEESGDMERLKAQISRKFKGDIDSFHSCGDEVFYSSKFFWRLNANIEIRLYYCQALKVVTIHLFNQSNGEELPNVYLCMNRIERKLSSIDHEVQNALKVTNGNGLYSKEELHSIEERLRWDFIAKYIVSILNIKESMSDEDEIQDASFTSTVRFIPYLKAEVETGTYLSNEVFFALRKNSMLTTNSSFFFEHAKVIALMT